jgi:SARP family transcriptional regulator, regulator of embCAB operon
MAIACSNVMSMECTSRAWVWAARASSSSLLPRTTKPQSHLITLVISDLPFWVVSCDDISGRLAKGWAVVTLRIYLTSRVRVENGDLLLDERDLPGRQGRFVLAYLVAERTRPVSRDELSLELWGDEFPEAWEKGLMAIISKLRSALRRVGLPADTLRTAFGCYQLALPADTWVDIEDAATAVHAAEAAIAVGRPRDGYGWAYVAYHVGRRPFLIGEDGPWASRRRSALREVYLRALECAIVCDAANGELAEAVQAAEDLIALEPTRETAYQRLMCALAEAGNRAEALQVYERCRRLLDEELGVPPSAQTRAVYESVLQA